MLLEEARGKFGDQERCDIPELGAVAQIRCVHCAHWTHVEFGRCVDDVIEGLSRGSDGVGEEFLELGLCIIAGNVYGVTADAGAGDGGKKPGYSI